MKTPQRPPRRSRPCDRLVVGTPWAHRGYERGVLLIYDSSETYRTNNSEVEEWLASWERAAGTTRKVYTRGGHHTVAAVLRGEPWKGAA